MSIKANELRIGNWVSNGFGNYTVDANMLYDLANAISGAEMFSGIPLTPELLEKCGFEWETDKHKHLQKETLEGCLLTFYYCGGSLERVQFYTNDSWDLYDHPATNFKFLHQLQNIYFSLTGEELQINL